MHWLHVYPNSDSSTFRHFFGTFWASFWKNFGKYYAVIWQIFCHKMLGNLLLSFFWQIFCTWQTFSIFLAKFWQIFGKKKELADFWNLVVVFLLNFETNFGGKLSQKSAKNSRNRNSYLRVANA